LTSWETFSGLSGAGEVVFALSGTVEKVRWDVTSFGSSNQVDPSGSFPRFFKLGWWAFTDNLHGLGQAALSPYYFIDFEHTWYQPTDGVNFNPNGFHGIHYNLFPGVVATLNVGET
jgi:hypothetical protein